MLNLNAKQLVLFFFNQNQMKNWNQARFYTLDFNLQITIIVLLTLVLVLNKSALKMRTLSLKAADRPFWHTLNSTPLFVFALAPQQYPGYLGAPGGRLPPSGQRSPPSQFQKEEGLQASAATAAILNLSTRYRKNMEAVAGRPLATSTKVIKLDHLERYLMWSF